MQMTVPECARQNVAASHRSMKRRCRVHDYKGRSIYLITLEVAGRRRLLGRIATASRPAHLADGEGPEMPLSVAGLSEAELAAINEPLFEPSELGRRVSEEFMKIGEHVAGVKPLLAQAMPDHFHGILFVTRETNRTLGSIMAGFKGKCSQVARELGVTQALTRRAPDLGAPPPPRRASGLGAPQPTRRAPDPGAPPPPRRAPDPGAPQPTRRASGLGAPQPTRRASGPTVCAPSARSGGAAVTPPLWEEGFHDRILTSDGQLEKMFRYVRDNPRRLALRLRHPDLFTSVRCLAGHGHTFDAFGNGFLLQRERIAQVQCSRAFFGFKREEKLGLMPGALGRRGLKIARNAAGEAITAFETPEFAAKKADLFAEAKKGAALCSPCISDGEKAIAYAAIDAGHSLIVLRNEPFPSRFKPSGRFFDACAEGRLLMLYPRALTRRAPDRTEQAGAERRLSRGECVTLNALAAEICGGNAADIVYQSRLGINPV